MMYWKTAVPLIDAVDLVLHVPDGGDEAAERLYNLLIDHTCVTLDSQQEIRAGLHVSPSVP